MDLYAGATLAILATLAIVACWRPLIKTHWEIFAHHIAFYGAITEFRKALPNETGIEHEQNDRQCDPDLTS